MSASIVEILAGDDAKDGINFHGALDERLLEEALERLHHELQHISSPVYFLRLHVSGESAWFQPMGNMRPPLGLQIPSRVPLTVLVPDYWTWTLLGVRHRSNTGGSQTQVETEAQRNAFLDQITWHAQIRIQQGNEYIGYFKIVGLGTPPPSSHDLLAAFYLTKLQVMKSLAHRSINQANVREELRLRMHKCVSALSDPRSADVKTALHHVADMLTSHLGVGWNRAACFFQADKNTLRCVWAQGGDGTAHWSAAVQEPLTRIAPDLDDLVSFARVNPSPHDDGYFAAAAGNVPLEVKDISDPQNENILASLWRHDGDVRCLPSENQEWELDYQPNGQPTQTDQDPLRFGGPIAATFTQSDPWVQQVHRERPTDPIFISRNNRYWALPWRSATGLIGIWVVDVAYWDVPWTSTPFAPSLGLSRFVLESLAPLFEQHRAKFWSQ